MRRIAVLALVGLLIAACGDSPKRATLTQARSDVPRAASDPARASAAAASVNQFGLDLLRRNIGLTKGNVALSPWSIATAVAMVSLGAAGETAAEIDRVLHAGAGFHDAMNALVQELATRNGTFDRAPTQPRSVELAAANRAFAQAGLKFQQPFLDGLSRSYGASLGLVDYKAAFEKARVEINGWVGQQTRTRIPELLPRDSLDEDTRLVLVNAVFLKADWLFPFAKDATADGVFHAPSGDVSVPVMHDSTSGAQYAHGDGWRAVHLDYVGEKLGMTVVVPDAGRYDAVLAKLDVAMFQRMTTVAEPVRVALALPKFDIARATELKPELAALGMPTAFADNADFSAMTTDEPLKIAKVLHQANVAVDEQGTVAAAATAVASVLAVTDAGEVVTVIVDRPFLFFVRDKPTGAILFAGQVTNPAAR